MRWMLVATLFVSLAATTRAAEFNAGFVEGLWYSNEQIFADQPTRIYAAVRNNTGADLTGSVEFYVDGKRIKRNNVSALDGRIIETWADWTPTYGEHTISATLSRIELHAVGSSTEKIEVSSALAKDTFFVDYDTDGDKIGNKEDTDDDGDGVSDIDEEKNGTDPLDPDDPAPEPEDTFSDSDAVASSPTGSGEDQGSDTTVNRGTDTPEGLEQYLTESRADSALTSITETINTTKKRIDDYRETRNTSDTDETNEDDTQTNTDEIKEREQGDSSASSTAATNSQNEINENGFGEVTRAKSETGSGLAATVIGAIGNLISSLYTLVLFLISRYLGHPILVQLTLLILILFLILKIARRLGRRPM